MTTTTTGEISVINIEGKDTWDRRSLLMVFSSAWPCLGPAYLWFAYLISMYAVCPGKGLLKEFMSRRKFSDVVDLSEGLESHL